MSIRSTVRLSSPSEINQKAFNSERNLIHSISADANKADSLLMQIKINNVNVNDTEEKRERII